MTRPPAAHPRPGTAVTALAVRQLWRGAAVAAAAAAGMSALVAGTYHGMVGDQLDGSSFAALAANPAIRTLFGEPAALHDPGGFTVWRTGTVVTVLVGVWALLAVTRTTRGEEDAGRFDLLLSGRLTLAGVLARQLAVLVAAVALAGAAVTAALLATGTDPAGAALHGAGVAAAGLFFAAAAGLAAQVLPHRAAASGAGLAVLGVGLLARMIGDGAQALSWLRWLTPFGLLELSAPYAGNRWSPVLALGAVALCLAAAGPVLAARRDLHGSLLRPATGRAPRLLLLGSVPAFAVRRLLGPFAGWALGIGAYYLLIGLIADSMAGFLTDNPRFAELAAQAGFASLGSVEGYAGTLFTLLTVPIGVFTAARIAALAADETGRRLTLLYAQPVARRTALAAEAAGAAAAAAGLALVAGTATWAGAAVAGAGLSLPDALAGALNVLPVPALCLGAAAFALGLVPRAVALIGTLPAAGGFLLHVIVDSVDGPGWAERLSPFAYLATVPAERPDWAGTAGMAALSAALFAVGLWSYQRRDLRTS